MRCINSEISVLLFPQPERLSLYKSVDLGTGRARKRGYGRERWNRGDSLTWMYLLFAPSIITAFVKPERHLGLE